MKAKPLGPGGRVVDTREGYDLWAAIKAVDEALAERARRAKTYLGWIMLFAMRPES